jgi:hypothetical protein
VGEPDPSRTRARRAEPCRAHRPCGGPG